MTSFISFILVSLLFLTSALAVPLHKRDVVDPPVTAPNASTVWTAGSTQLVVWDTSKLPPYNQITNKVGTVVLGFLDSNGENLMLDKPLAKGFNITQGSIQVVVPNVQTRTNYIIVLMGDSGNASPTFSILSDSPRPVGDSGTPAPTPSGPPPTTDGTTPVSSPSPTGGTATGSASITPGSESSPNTTGSSTSTPSSSPPLTTSVTTSVTSSAAVQATTTSSNGAAPMHRAGATCFGAVLVLASLLL
ncbi:hypothetical protein M378DRAFT_199551 [Amanita muscaria Koide BX008]|uniref:Uncharacterized protein n=1 Tax=Amanita muscaria (strain Koide BX008) TaxID=946122 RepID=A0A0C2T4C4_AMAMK|nr:hypothetical protein M378DRAFT_199551 [Amanita muscaria Koide BX008]